MTGNRDRNIIAGDRLLAHLRSRSPNNEQIWIEPAPTSWAVLKPHVLAHLESLRARGEPMPHFVHYPLCAIGAGGLDLPTVRSPYESRHAACDACGLRHRCSPPASFSDELSPFGPRHPGQRWRRFHRRLCAQLGVDPRPEQEAFVDQVIEVLVGPLAGVELSVEPSISIAEGLVPAIRLAVFHHYSSLGPQADHQATMQLIESFGGLHELLGSAPPPGLLPLLRRHAPFALPVGFDARPDAPPLTKCYVVVERLSDEKKRALLLELLDLAGTRPGRIVDEIVWRELDMIGLATEGGAIDMVKIYERRNPTVAWPAASLPALSPSHPAVLLSGGRAYATVDVHARTRRHAKWDLRVRDQLLTGPILSRAFAPVLAPGGASALARLVDHRDFRVDTVAVAVRDRHTTFYLDLE